MSDNKEDNILPPERIWLRSTESSPIEQFTWFDKMTIDDDIEYIRVSELLVWLNDQIMGIQRSSIVEASRGAMNGFIQLRRKLMGISFIDKYDSSPIPSRRHAFKFDSRAPEVCNQTVSLKDPYYCEMKRDHPIHLSDDVVNDRRVPFETDDKR